MTKRKMQTLIIFGIFTLFCCATLMNYISAGADVSDQMQDIWNTSYNSALLYQCEDNFEDCDLNDLHQEISYSWNPTLTTSAKPAYAFAMVDREGNVLFESENGVWWSLVKERGNGYNYISLEEYMTSEIKKEIVRMQKKAKNRMLMIDSMELNFDGEKYRPVSITIDFQSGYEKKFILSNLEVTETVGGSSSIIFYNFYDLDENSIDHKYYLKLQKKLDDAIENYEYNENYGGGGQTAPGELSWDSNQRNFAFFYFVEYNPFYENITSEMFRMLTVYMSVIFGIMTIIILTVASNLYDKNQNLNEAKRAFTSAAAHELKTPLAVIQNQCECIIDNIAPEKNEQYVRSIYDEAVRMNGIVQSLLTFNRLSDASEIHKEKCNLSEIVKAEAKKYESFAQQMNVKITEEIDENIFAECNAQLIAMAIDNYLSNAIKYADNEKNVKVALRKEHKGFCFRVYNDCGNPDIGNEVWELLTRGDKSRGNNGGSTGMGLPVCRKIFRLHSYEHWFSKENDGISFIFRSNG